MACATCKAESHETADHGKAGKSDWIGSAIKHPGALHRDLSVAMGSKIPAGKLKAAAGGQFGAKTAARAKFAQQLHSFHSSK